LLTGHCPAAATNGSPADARSVVVTQPNNKLSRVLKALLRELPAQLAAVDAASLEASVAMSEGAAAGAGAEALEYAQERLAERLRLVRGLQVRGVRAAVGFLGNGSKATTTRPRLCSGLKHVQRSLVCRYPKQHPFWLLTSSAQR
jgi:hypothetical protein